MFNSLFQFVKKHFLTRKFLTFALIGVVNTAIDYAVYMFFYNSITVGVAYLSKGAAFLVASVFSYFANAILTFKPDARTTRQFFAVMFVFLVRMFLTMALAAGIDTLVQEGLGIDYAVIPLAKGITPLLSSIVMVPIAFFALEVVFREFGRKHYE